MSAFGVFGSLRNLLDSGLEQLQVRLALLGNEIEEQKVRVVEGLVMAILGAMLLAVAALLVCGFVLVLFWDGHRLLALGVMTALVGGGGAWLVQAGRARLRTSGEVFQASIDELRQDREALARGAQAAPGQDAP